MQNLQVTGLKMMVGPIVWPSRSPDMAHYIFF
jgi:hypothetical protein